MGDQKKVWIVAAVLFVVALVVTIVVLATNNDEQAVPPAPEEPSAAPAPTVVPPTAPPVLASGQDEDFVFEVVGVEAGIPATVDGERVAEGSFTFVTLTVKNVGDEPLGFDRADVVAVDSWGRTLVNDVQDRFVETVAPGGEIQTAVAFDVTDGTSLTALIATGESSGPVATMEGVQIPLP